MLTEQVREEVLSWLIARAAGEAAYKRGEPFASCPYKKKKGVDLEEDSAWKGGWNSAYLAACYGGS